MQPTDYGALAERYAHHRRFNPDVLSRLVYTLAPTDTVLEVGCGTGNYLAEIEARVGCTCIGIDPSLPMLHQFRARGTSAALHVGVAEELEAPSGSCDLVYSVDVVHHVGNLRAAFHEAFRVLRPGGSACTVTDSQKVIRDRTPLSEYFPETVEVELGRYPTIETLRSEMEIAGFVSLREDLAEFTYELTESSAYRDKVFSSLRYLEPAAFERGLARLEADLAEGPVPCTSRYTMLWGARPTKIP